MSKILLVCKNEFIVTVFRKSFLITLFLIPILGFLATWIIGSIENGQSSTFITDLFKPTEEEPVEGLVDPGKIIKVIPDEFSGNLIPFASQSAAEEALSKGDIASYYLVSPDYIESGEITYVRKDYNPLGGLENTNTIEQVIAFNLLQNDASLVDRFYQIMNLEAVTLTNAPEGSPETMQSEEQRDPESALTFFIPYIVCFLFYIVLMGSSSLMLSSIANEKENRSLEVLLTSVSPTQMLTGKIIALGIVGLAQTIIWSGTGLLLLRLSGRTFNIPDTYQIPVSILIWGIIYFLLGYAIYASLMAGVGALVPNMREASQATLVVMLPLFLPLILISNMIMNPNGILTTTLSIFPLTSPIVMMTRLAAVNVPVWQLILSIFLVIATAIFTVRVVASLFRAQILLSGQGFKLKTFFRALSGHDITVSERR